MTAEVVIRFMSDALNSMTDDDHEVDPNDTLGELFRKMNLESLDTADIATRIEKRFGLRVDHLIESKKPLDELMLLTLREVAGLVLAQRTRD